MKKQLRVLIVGCGTMGSSHAVAYQQLDGFELAGLVSRNPETREALDRKLTSGRTAGPAHDLTAGRSPNGQPVHGPSHDMQPVHGPHPLGYPLYDDFYRALSETGPDVVSINTYPDTHEVFALAALKAGCHLFVEKPLATTVEGAKRIVETAQKSGRKLVVGYILRHHPSWNTFIDIARTLGKPLVMRMNLNQQSSGRGWQAQKNLMDSIPPIVDCGVHYVDVMCRMTRSAPIRVSAIGARLSEELKPGMYNYGQLQVLFADGSVGWYEAGWGPMMSETAFFVKDVVGPKGSVSIGAEKAGSQSQSSNIDSHTKTDSLRIHYSELVEGGTVPGSFAREDEIIDLHDEPDHQELCTREQRFLLKAIHDDIDLTDHMNDAVNSLAIVLAADQSVCTGKTVELDRNS